MIEKPSLKCSCVTYGNLSCSSDVSPWSHNNIATSGGNCGRHTLGGRSVCSEHLLKSSKLLSTSTKHSNKPITNKSLLRRKPSGNEYKFSHLQPDEHILKYKKTCCSASCETFYIVKNTADSQNLAQQQSVQDTPLSLCYSSIAKPVVLHEINLVIPRTVMHHPKLLRPSPPDLWYNTSTVESTFQVRGSSCNVSAAKTNRSESSNGIDLTIDQTKKAFSLKTPPPHRPTLYIDFTERLKCLDNYPVYGTVVDDISLHDVVQRCPLKKKRRYYHYTPSKVNPMKSMEEGFKNLCISPPSEIHGNAPGQLLTGKMRAKSDAGCFNDDKPNITSTLVGKKIRTSSANPENAIIKGKTTPSEKKDSRSTPSNVFKVCIRKPIQPPLVTYPNKDPVLVVGNPDLFKYSDDSKTKRPPSSNNVKYRFNLDASLQPGRWRRERKSACYRRSSQRKSRKWLFLNDVGELQQIIIKEPVSILEDIINAE